VRPGRGGGAASRPKGVDSISLPRRVQLGSVDTPSRRGLCTRTGAVSDGSNRHQRHPFFYSKNFNDPDSRENQLHNFDFYAQRPRLNMAEVGLSHDPAPLGFEIDFGLGDTYKLVGSTEPDSPLKNILQFTVSLKPAAWHGIQADFGKFQTSAGIESAETLSGWNYSRSILFTYAQSNYHFGLRTVAPIGRKIEVGLQIVNGWIRMLDGNGGKTLGITGDSKTDKLSWYNDYYMGPERVDGAELRRTLFAAGVTER